LQLVHPSLLADFHWKAILPKLELEKQILKFVQQKVREVSAHYEEDA